MADRIKTAMFSPDDLELVRKAPPPDVPPLAVGDRCRFNSGGPSLLVVDAGPSAVVISLPDGEEHETPRACVRRIEMEAA